MLCPTFLIVYRGHQGVVWCMSTKNKKLYTAGADCMIKVWDLENLSRGCIKTIQGHTGEVCIQLGEVVLCRILQRAVSKLSSAVLEG